MLTPSLGKVSLLCLFESVFLLSFCTFTFTFCVFHLMSFESKLTGLFKDKKKTKKTGKSMCSFPDACDMQLFIVWMMAGIAEGDGMQGNDTNEAVEGAKAMVITLAFFVVQPMKMGQRRSSVYQPSVTVMIKSDSESLAGISHHNRLKTGTTAVTTTMLV
jgi:hypothetical protein